MGNSNQPFSTTQYDWRTITKGTSSDIVQDTKTGIQAQRHIVPYNPAISADDEIAIYSYRSRTNKPIVKTYSAYLQGTNSSCGGPQDIIVNNQLIPYRLNQVRNLNYGQALYVLSEALYGFQELHHRFGSFQITEDLICFNSSGQVRVWNNPNLSTNRLARDYIILMSTKNPKNFDQRLSKSQEENMVEDIWNAIAGHAQLSEEFAHATNEMQGLNFVDARRMVNEQILGGTLLHIPNHLNFGDRSTQSYSNNRPEQNFSAGYQL